MKTFIKKQQFNYIKKCLNNLNNALKGSVDIDIIQVTRAYMQEKILSIFTDLSNEEREMLDISNLTDSMDISKYIDELNPYVYGMESITNSQISKLFKKEKKLKLPSLETLELKNVYLGWIDEATRKLFIAYNMNGKLLGMACRITNHTSNNKRVCSLCNRIGGNDEVAFVSPICKTNNAAEGGYKSIGFDVCLDSNKCNDRIISIENLEKFLKDVNNIK